MGMFDSLQDERGDEWQTKAYECALVRYSTGDAMPPIVGAPDRYQVEVLGQTDEAFVDAFATVARGVLVAVGVERDARLSLVTYDGRLVA